MPFQRKTASSSDAPAAAVAATVAEPVATEAVPTATPAPAAAPVAAPPRLADQIDDYASQVSSALQESMLISPDAEFLPPAMVDGLRAVAAKLGFAYDPSTMGTFYFVVTQTAAKYLAGPTLQHQGGSPVIKWGDQFIALDPNESMYSDNWRLLVGGENEQTQLLFDPKGLYFPVSVKPDVATADEAKEFKKQLGTLDTFGQVTKWLRNAIAPQGIYKLDEGKAFQAESVSDPIESRDGGNTYRVLEAIYEDETACRWYVSDDANVNWGLLQYPAVCTREGQALVIEQPSGNLQVAIKAPIMKLGDALKEGKTYKVLAYEEDNSGKFGLQINLTVEIDGAPQKIRTNRALEERVLSLKAHGQENFETNPAHVIVDSIRQTKDGKTRVSARLITKADLENPLMQRLMQQQKARQSA
jgi:hypothetical protein